MKCPLGLRTLPEQAALNYRCPNTKPEGVVLMSAVTLEGSKVHLQIEANTLGFLKVEREENTIRIIFRQEHEAEEVESTLLAAGELRRPAVLPPLRRVDRR